MSGRDGMRSSGHHTGTPARLSAYGRDDIKKNSAFPKEWFDTTGNVVPVFGYKPGSPDVAPDDPPPNTI